MNVLVTGMHLDDCECLAGTTKLLVNKGANITYLNLKPYLHFKGPNPEAERQSLKSAEILGAKKVIFDYDGTKFYKTNETTVRMTEELILDIRPDIVFMMHPKDTHLEHVECARTVREALFSAAVFGFSVHEIYSYEVGQTQNMSYFLPDFYINVEDVLDTMKDATFVFNMNFAHGNSLWNEYYARICNRGIAAGMRYAEGFKIIKYPSNGDDFYLRETLRDQFRWHNNGVDISFTELFF